MAARTPGVCDALGYSQHADDCAMNTIQELFFFADNIKEWTQPLFLSLTEQQVAFYVDKYIAENPDAGGELVTASFTIRRRTSLLRGLLAIRQRFISHYEYIVAQREAHAAAQKNLRHTEFNYTKVRALYKENSSDMALSKRRGSEDRGQLVKREFESNRQKRKRTCADVSTMHGTKNSISTFTLLCKIFGIPFAPIRTAKSAFTSAFDPVAICFKTYFLEKKEIPETGDRVYTVSDSSSHAVALMRCNGDWYYYDGIYGMIPIHPDMKTAWVTAVLNDEPLTVKISNGFCFLMKTRGVDVKGRLPVVDPSDAPTPHVESIWTLSGWSTSEDISTMVGNDTASIYEFYARDVLLDKEEEEDTQLDPLLKHYFTLVEQEMGRVFPPAVWPPSPPSPPPPPPLPPRAPSFRPKSATAPLPKNPPPRTHGKTRRRRRRV